MNKTNRAFRIWPLSNVNNHLLENKRERSSNSLNKRFYGGKIENFQSCWAPITASNQIHHFIACDCTQILVWWFLSYTNFSHRIFFRDAFHLLLFTVYDNGYTFLSTLTRVSNILFFITLAIRHHTTCTYVSHYTKSIEQLIGHFCWFSALSALAANLFCPIRSNHNLVILELSHFTDSMYSSFGFVLTATFYCLDLLCKYFFTLA